jgi:hypothetical protein
MKQSLYSLDVQSVHAPDNNWIFNPGIISQFIHFYSFIQLIHFIVDSFFLKKRLIFYLSKYINFLNLKFIFSYF